MFLVAYSAAGKMETNILDVRKYYMTATFHIVSDNIHIHMWYNIYLFKKLFVLINKNWQVIITRI